MQEKYFAVNWIDGMKINKEHFLQSDMFNLWQNRQLGMSFVTPISYGVLPPLNQEEENFSVNVAVDNQNTIRVSVNKLEAVTAGGVRISINMADQQAEDGTPGKVFPFSAPGSPTVYWVVLMANPFERKPAGQPLMNENPPRMPNLRPQYDYLLVSEAQYGQYARNPYCLFIGKVLAGPNEVRADTDYIPPSLTVGAYPDLVAFFNEYDQFLSNLERYCIVIIQKILSKKQENELAELVQHLCDRMVLFLSSSISEMRGLVVNQTPAVLFSHISSFARVVKNSLDMRLGSGKEEMMNYIISWSELKQGELDSLLASLASMRYNHNDINQNISRIVQFVNVMGKLFESLNKLDYIGKKERRETYIDNTEKPLAEAEQPKPKRRFF